jgi:hypothetical protein
VNPALLPAPHLLTAPGREAILAGTLGSWDDTDWPARPVIHLDRGRADTPAQQRIPAAWGAMLRAALDAGEPGPHLLLCEDDLAFARHLRAALLAWPPLREGRLVTFGSLYDPVHFFGAQALVLARPFARWAAAHWEEVGGVQSRRLVALAQRFAPGAAIPVHRPSLVQHTAILSSWGTRLHRAPLFDPDWRPPVPAS